MDTIERWQWQYTDEFGKRRVSRWKMSAEQAAQYKNAVRVEGTREVRRELGLTSDFGRSQTTSTPGTTTNAPGISSDSGCSKG